MRWNLFCPRWRPVINKRLTGLEGGICRPYRPTFQKAGEPMANKLLTDVELRANWSLHHQEDYAVEEGTILTPAAVDFLREHNIRLRYVVPERPGASMTRTPIPVRNGKACYVYAATGRELHEKPEEMTHLRGNQLVPKTHPRIAFRGKLDSLMAQLMEVEVMAAEAGRNGPHGSGGAAELHPADPGRGGEGRAFERAASFGVG